MRPFRATELLQPLPCIHILRFVISPQAHQATSVAMQQRHVDAVAKGLEVRDAAMEAAVALVDEAGVHLRGIWRILLIALFYDLASSKVVKKGYGSAQRD